MRLARTVGLQYLVLRRRSWLTRTRDHDLAAGPLTANLWPASPPWSEFSPSQLGAAAEHAGHAPSAGTRARACVTARGSLCVT